MLLSKHNIVSDLVESVNNLAQNIGVNEVTSSAESKKIVVTVAGSVVKKSLSDVFVKI